MYLFINVYFWEIMSRGGAEREADRRSEEGSALIAVGLMWDLNSWTVRL